MPSIFWPKRDVEEIRVNSAQQQIDERLAQFERDQQEREALTARPAQTTAPTPGAWDFSSLRGALMPWDQSQQQASQMPAQQPPQAQPDAWDFSSLKASLMPWQPQQQPQAAQPGQSVNGVPAAAPATGTMGISAGMGQPTGEIDNSSRESFVRTAYPYALHAAGGDRKLAEQLLATAISENGKVGTGESLGGMGFNVGGIQGVEGTAGSFSALDAGRPRQFAAYNNLSEGFAAVKNLITQSPRYQAAYQRYQQTGDVDQFWQEVNAAGYAEDPNWATKVGNIRQNQVTPLVQGLPQQPATPAPQGQPTAAGSIQVVPNAQPNSYWTSSGTHGGAPAADIFAPVGSPILAPVGGTVRAFSAPLGGNAAILQGDDGRYYYFAHANDQMVSGRVKPGQQIGAVGQSGNARGTDPHLHYAIATDPSVFDAKNGSGDVEGESYWRTPDGQVHSSGDGHNHGDPRQSSMNTAGAALPSASASAVGPGDASPPGPAVPPMVAQRWEAKFGRPMTEQEATELQQAMSAMGVM